MKPHSSPSNRFDVIIIGSGAGGLTLGSFLAKINKKRVLILEKHYEIGGLTHEFSRGKYYWDVGVHYIGKMNPGTRERLLMDFLTNNQLEWNSMPPIYDRIVFPDLDFGIPNSKQQYRKKLVATFPSEKSAIYKYFSDLYKARFWFIIHFLGTFIPKPISYLLKWLSLPFRKLALTKTQEYMNTHFKDERLKSLLCSRWGNYGMPPAQSAFVYNSIIDTHYIHGGFYPKGGAEKIGLYMEENIEHAGGTVLINKQVTEIIIENNTAIGVKMIDIYDPEKREIPIYADTIVSNAGAYTTFLKILPEKLNLPIQKQLKTIPYGYSLVGLFIGFKESPASLGVHGENWWIFESYDHEKAVREPERLLSGHPHSVFVSFPSLKDSKQHSFTGEILAFVPYAVFEQWKNEPWKNRDQSYYQLKDQIAQGLLAFVEQHIPGFSALIDYTELSTPLSMEYFTNQSFGAMYGIPAVAERYKIKSLGVKTPIKNLYLTGSDICMMGIMGAVNGGMATASYLNGPFGIIRMLASARIEQSKRKKLAKKNPQEGAHGSNRPSLPVFDFPWSNKHHATLTGMRPISNTVFEIRLQLDRDFFYVPCQHIKIQVNHFEWRSYSIVSKQDTEITFLVDTKFNGKGAQYFNSLRIGDDCIIRLAMNNLFFKENGKNLLFIATGIGVTPFFSILDHQIRNHRSNPTTLIYGCSDESDDYITSYLEPFHKQIPLDVTICIRNTQNLQRYYPGRVTDWLKNTPYDPANTDCYICGNPKMIQESIAILRGQGFQTIHW